MQTDTGVNMVDMEKKKMESMAKSASKLAELHRILTSKRSGKFRIELLQACSVATFCTEIDCLREDKSLGESERHVNQLMAFKLITEKEKEGHKTFLRTKNGEKAVNAVKALVGWVGDEQADKIFNAHFGENSILLFLKVYSKKGLESANSKEVSFSPLELGRLTLFVPRTIDGMAAFEKLSDAGLLVYKEDGNIYMSPVVVRYFYRYLSKLYDIVKVKIFKKRKDYR